MIRRLPLLIAVLVAVAVPGVAAEFDHAGHLAYVDGGDCAVCHQAGAAEIIPASGVCLECHDQGFVDQVEMPGLKTHGPLWALNHRPFAKGSTYDCSACHEQDACLECHKSGFADEQGSFGNQMVNVHRSDFHVTHPIAARTDPQRCSSCHETRFCVECHENFAPGDLAILSHRRGWSDIAVTSGAHAGFQEDSCQACHRDSVLTSNQWSNSHAREARKNLVTCQACHPDGDICLRCHSAVSGLVINPHPKDWDDIKDRLKRASDGRTCRKCH